jgi:hypothetical protein
MLTTAVLVTSTHLLFRAWVVFEVLLQRLMCGVVGVIGVTGGSFILWRPARWPQLLEVGETCHDQQPLLTSERVCLLLCVEWVWKLQTANGVVSYTDVDSQQLLADSYELDQWSLALPFWALLAVLGTNIVPQRCSAAGKS